LSSAFDVEPDPARARRFLEVAKGLLRDCELPNLSLEATFFLAHQACISAMEAVAASAGRAIGPGEGSTVVLLREANAVLGPGYNDLFESLAIGRQERNEASYREATITENQTQVMFEDARDLVAAVESFLSRS
jgi:HEPN domain-containing protein